MKIKILLIGIFIALSTMGSSCINDAFLVAINVEGISGIYHVNRGDNVFGPPEDSCRTIDPSDYLNGDYDNFEAVRIYDIRITTIGDFAGSVTSASLTANGNEILHYSGSWNAFHVPQSVLTSPLIDRSNVLLLANAILNKERLTLCGMGTLSQDVNQDDLYVQIDVFAQVDGELK